ncbi:ribosomal protein S18-alanine N-acetyltransferase [Aliikangiella sp. G2MR2-5]|uniref:ribosomal protein S18-alanine N-acetyltransferase n=1 Tax=Aliikangiella sp. G2MR2-5 TaxID=2788943 RepID=UPI0018AC6C70|nr:ribosomal protein S18-alanine N-acetyltransferase [Aliikangiella sp. G2MR2-5]
MIVRSVRPADLPAIWKIEKESHPFPWSEKALKDSMNGQIFNCLEKQGNIIGFYILAQVLDELEILNIAVSPSLQGKGLGTLLMKDIRSLATRREVNTIFLEVRSSNLKAISLYKRAGFESIGIRKQYYRSDNGREDAIMMKLLLEQKAENF